MNAKQYYRATPKTTLCKEPAVRGFTLIEVVLALGIFAVAIPAVIGMIGIFSSSTQSMLESGATTSAVSVFEPYLNGEMQDVDKSLNGEMQDVDKSSVSFAKAYGWAYEARTGTETVIYAYKESRDQAEHFISQKAPTTHDGPILAAKVLPVASNLLPADKFVASPSAYTQSYLPLKLEIHALSSASETLTPENFVTSYPMVLSR